MLLCSAAVRYRSSRGGYLRHVRPIVATVALAAILAGAVVTWASGDEASSSEDYWLGPSFGGHALDETSGGSSFYGDCEPPPGEGGCGAPIEVQNATTCTRNPLAIDLLPRRVSRVRGGGLATGRSRCRRESSASR